MNRDFPTTCPLLQVNYNARGGRLRVEVLDADFNVIPGYGRDDMKALADQGAEAFFEARPDLFE